MSKPFKENSQQQIPPNSSVASIFQPEQKPESAKPTEREIKLRHDAQRLDDECKALIQLALDGK